MNEVYVEEVENPGYGPKYLLRWHGKPKSLIGCWWSMEELKSFIKERGYITGTW